MKAIHDAELLVLQATATREHVNKAYDLFKASTMAALQAGLGEV